MPHARDVLYMVGAALLGVLLVYVVGLRRRSYGRHLVEVAEAEVCEHLRPALELLRSRGYTEVHLLHGAYEFGKDSIGQRARARDMVRHPLVPRRLLVRRLIE